MATAKIQNSAYKKALLLVGSLLVLFLLFSLRNLDPILYPTVYAEDAVWTGKVIDHGFWNTAFHTRVFPILGFAVFYKIALVLLDLFCNGNLFYLPLIYFILSNIFFSLCVLAGYFALRNLLSRSSLVCLLLAIVLMPVGLDGNEIYGRLLNLGFIFPVLQVLLLSALLLNKQSIPLAIVVMVTALLSCLTLPVGVGVQVIFGIVCVYNGFKNKSRYFYSLAAFSVAIVLASMIAISGNAIHDSGGADFPVKASALIEFALARVLLYPVLFSIYHHLNDIVVIAVVLCLLGVMFYAAKRFFNNGKIIIDKRLLAILFVWASFGIYYLSIVVMRRGLSSLFFDYTVTFPDRYFLGLNILFVVALLMLLDKTVFAKIVCVILVVPMLLSVGKTFELGKPATKFSSSPLWTAEYCNYLFAEKDSGDGLLVSIPPENWVFHSESYSLTMEQRQTFQQRCKLSNLYSMPLLGKLVPPVLVQRNATADMGQLPVLGVVSVHNVAITALENGFSARVSGDDPYIVFGAHKTQSMQAHAAFHFSVASPVPTQFQAYYLMKNEPDYAEQNSIHFPVLKGENPLYLNANDTVSPDLIRIDLPDGSRDEFIFTGVKTSLVE
ncbi:hypothetical protein ACQ3G7_02710 [Kosakonia oryzendophytica]|uniref:hypothetical protein n=1 Tax=Kosakonia oryzendophytica TaxID=1005665 RepID=UPI003D32A917